MTIHKMWQNYDFDDSEEQLAQGIFSHQMQ